MSALQEYFQKTKQLIELFSLVDENNRDQILEQSETFFSDRDEILPLIKPPFTDEDRELYLHIQQLEGQLTALIEKEKTVLQKDIKRLSHTKESTKKYNNPYENINTDGMFYDKRN